METEVRIGLIGAGRIGKLHGNNLAHAVKGAKIEALADAMLNDSHREWAESLHIKKVYTDAGNIFNDKDIDAVFICSSTDTHAKYIIEAAKAGKQIFCEKPIDTDIEIINDAIDAAKIAGVKLQIGFVRRFDHNHKKVHDTVASGRLGNPHIIKVTSRDPEPQPIEYTSVSGGLFMDMMIHDFDMARYLAGSEVTEVTAYGTTLIDPRIKQYNDVDTAVVILKFENGALGVIDNSRASRYGYDQRTEVHCDKGAVQVGNDLVDTSMISTAEGVYCEKPTWFFLERYNNAFIAEAQAFVNSILNETPTSVDGKDGLMSVAIAKAADKSLKEGRPVKISEVAQ
jgi:myo-inositol 2-dehydrogenase/D-chiro-inositol 1-dehydrogenase